jgi:hypothetical protein
VAKATSGVLGGAAVLTALLLVAGLGERLRARDATPTAAASASSRLPGDLPNYMDDPGAASRRVDALARRTRGDFDQLSDLEQKWINAMTAGYGPQLLWRRTKQLKIKPQGAPPVDHRPRAARGGA